MSSTLVKVVVVVAAMLAFGCSSQTQDCCSPRANADPARGGAKLYRRYCGACHGLTAKGDGIVSSLMTPKPRDLTALTRDFGKFPREWLIRVTDGRETMRAHGDSNMPVWGTNLVTELGPDAGEEEVRNWIGTIADYIEEVQVE